MTAKIKNRMLLVWFCQQFTQLVLKLTRQSSTAVEHAAVRMHQFEGLGVGHMSRKAMDVGIGVGKGG